MNFKKVINIALFSYNTIYYKFRSRLLQESKKRESPVFQIIILMCFITA